MPINNYASALYHLGDKQKVAIHFPKPEFCTDNGAMIAYAGAQKLLRGETQGLGFQAKARWPLTDR